MPRSRAETSGAAGHVTKLSFQRSSNALTLALPALPHEGGIAKRVAGERRRAGRSREKGRSPLLPPVSLPLLPSLTAASTTVCLAPGSPGRCAACQRKGRSCAERAAWPARLLDSGINDSKGFVRLKLRRAGKRRRGTGCSSRGPPRDAHLITLPPCLIAEVCIPRLVTWRRAAPSGPGSASSPTPHVPCGTIMDKTTITEQLGFEE